MSSRTYRSVASISCTITGSFSTEASCSCMTKAFSCTCLVCASARRAATIPCALLARQVQPAGQRHHRGRLRHGCNVVHPGGQLLVADTVRAQHVGVEANGVQDGGLIARWRLLQTCLLLVEILTERDYCFDPTVSGALQYFGLEKSQISHIIHQDSQSKKKPRHFRREKSPMFEQIKRPHSKAECAIGHDCLQLT